MGGKILLLSGVLLGAVLIFLSIFMFGSKRTWHMLLVPSMSQGFADLRPIAGLPETLLLGQDPYLNHPGDPWHRKFNYPRIWFTVSYLKMNQEQVVYYGIGLVVLFMGGIFIFTSKYLSVSSALILLICIFSPSILLAIERGNIDLLMFFLLSMAIWIMNKDSLIRNMVGAFFVYFAFVLKIYPILGIGVLLSKEKGVSLKLLAFSFFLFFVYILLNLDSTKLSSQMIPKAVSLSYGLNVFWMWIKSRLDQNDLANTVRLISYFIAIGGSLLILFLANKVMGKYISSRDYCRRNLDAFRVGSGIYIGTFLFGNNYDYRLIFLLFTVPQLVSWCKADDKHIALISQASLLGVVAVLWSMSKGMNYIFLIHIFSSWAIFFGFMFLFLCSLPAWIRGTNI